METKLCTKCNEIKSISEFGVDKSRKDGLRYNCKRCVEIYLEDNKDKIKTYQQARRAYYVLARIKDRAKKKGLEFNLDLEDVDYPDVCPILGLKLERGTSGKSTNNSPSVDRINLEIGYVKGNIQVISQLANSMKSNATPEQLLMFANWVIKTYRK